MSEIWLPGDSDFALAMREPNLLVPNKRSIGSVVPNWKYIPNTSDLIAFLYFDGVSWRDFVDPSQICTIVGSNYNNSRGAFNITGGGVYVSLSKAITIPGRQTGASNGKCSFVVDGTVTSSKTTSKIIGLSGFNNGLMANTSRTEYIGAGSEWTTNAVVDGVCAFSSGNYNDNVAYAYINGLEQTFTDISMDCWAARTYVEFLGDSTYPTSNYITGSFKFLAIWASKLSADILQRASSDLYRWLTSANQSPYLISVPAGGGVTGTGDLVGAGSEVVGTGTRTVTGAGALEGQGAAVVGTGERTVTGTGALIGQGSDVAGTGATGGVHTGVGDLIGAGSEVVGVGYRTVTGTGVLVAQGSEVVGVGERTVIGSGDLVGAGAEVSGSGAVGGITTGTGDLVGAGSEIVGTGLRTVTGSGALVAQGSAVTGTGERVITGVGALIGSGSEIVGAGIGGDVTTGAGALVGQGSAVTGTGKRTITGIGELVAAGSIIVGAGVRTITGSGALVGAGSEVVGGQTEHDFETGNINTWMLGPRGRVWSLENRDPYDAHKRGREVCS